MRKISPNLFAAIVLTVLFSMVVLSNYDIFYEIFQIKITGLATTPTLGVSIESDTDGEILLTYDSVLNLGDKQEIYAEFVNTGSTSYSAAIEVHIYYLNQTSLDRIASYYDSTVQLYPGMRRGFRVSFRPAYDGVYYIKVSVPYSYKVAQTWAGFIVYGPGPPITTTVTVPPVTVPTPPAPALPVSAALLECVDNITILQGEFQSFDVRIKNTGETGLNNLRFYLSAPNVLNVNVSPKVISQLAIGGSSLFLITVGTDINGTEGIYPLELEFTTNELKLYKTVDVIVVPSNVSQVEHLEILLSNYKYLIDKVESEIYAASLQGYDVGNANESILKAKRNLELARGYLEDDDLDSTKRELRGLVTNLEDALLQLASAIMYVYEPPAFYPFLIILAEILLAIGIFLVFYINRKRKEKPKVLKESAEATAAT